MLVRKFLLKRKKNYYYIKINKKIFIFNFKIKKINKISKNLFIFFCFIHILLRFGLIVV